MRGMKVKQNEIKVDPSEKTTRSSFTIPIYLFDWLRLEAAKRGMSRSYFLTQLVSEERDKSNQRIRR
jgi:hypothetical protein